MERINMSLSISYLKLISKMLDIGSWAESLLSLGKSRRCTRGEEGKAFLNRGTSVSPTQQNALHADLWYWKAAELWGLQYLCIHFWQGQHKHPSPACEQIPPLRQSRPGRSKSYTHALVSLQPCISTAIFSSVWTNDMTHSNRDSHWSPCFLTLLLNLVQRISA